MTADADGSGTSLVLKRLAPFLETQSSRQSRGLNRRGAVGHRPLSSTALDDEIENIQSRADV
jgi:hypothetical protein